MRTRTRVKYKPNFAFTRNKIPDAKRKVGVRQGALHRKIQRRLIRTRKKVSEPGKPPTNREGQLKKFIFYSWDAANQRVVSGPEKLPGATGDVPAVLEGTRRGRVRPRPSAGPALEKAKDNMPELWDGAIK